MDFQTTPISGLIIVKPTVYNDSRGYFFESYNEKLFKGNGITDCFVQDNQSCSSKGVVRGLHFQIPPFAQSKLVRVISGAALDVAVDIRVGSPTYGKYFSILLSGENQLQFYIPMGFAHGFAALEDNTVFAYKCGNFYNKESERNIIFNDPDIAVDWGTENPLISDKDKQGVLFRNFDSPFIY